jgi:hypothetical protein
MSQGKKSGERLRNLTKKPVTLTGFFIAPQTGYAIILTLFLSEGYDAEEEFFHAAGDVALAGLGLMVHDTQFAHQAK